MKSLKNMLLFLSAALCLTAALTGCSATVTSGASSAQEVETVNTESDWLELGEEGILTVRIPLEKREGFVWQPSVADGSPLELLTQETTDTEYVASFRATGSGEANLSLSYVSEDMLAEARNVEMTCKDGKVTDILSHVVMEMEMPLETENNHAESLAATGKVVTPLPLTVDIATLEDCTVAVSVPEGGIYLDDDGAARMEATVYAYDLYDMVDIAGLVPGDEMELRGENVLVTSVERTDAGLVILNGGLEQGGFELATDDTGVYFESGFDDARTWTALGTVTLPVNEEFTFVDSSDLESGEEIWYAGDFLAPDTDIRYDFTPYNTTITIRNGQVIAMHRVFVP